MTFEECWNKEFPNAKPHSAEKDLAEAFWDAGYEAAKDDIQGRLENHDMATAWWDMHLEKDDERWAEDIKEIMGE